MRSRDSVNFIQALVNTSHFDGWFVVGFVLGYCSGGRVTLESLFEHLAIDKVFGRIGAKMPRLVIHLNARILAPMHPNTL